MKLSIIVPVFNEEKSVAAIIDRLMDVSLSRVEKEIIVVDDGSSDKTAEKLNKIKKKYKSIHIFSHAKNQGKGRAVVTGISHANGEYILIQDADLEYDPKYIPALLKPLEKYDGDVVYGTRLKQLPKLRGSQTEFLFLLHYFGNRFLSLLTSAFYGQWITDMETCYKLFPRHALDGITLHARGFELEPEITAKLLKKKYHVIEVPITTVPRGYDDGKKLHTGKDGIKALWALVKYRFTD